MRYIKLVRGEGYGPIFDMTFWYDQPMQVTEEQFEYLISLGKFREVLQPATEGEEELTVACLHSSEDDVPYNAYEGMFSESKELPKTAQNLFGNDNLNGKRILLRRNAAIGDTLFVIQIAGYLKKKYPTSYITIAVAPLLLDFSSQFACIDSVITLEDSCKYDHVSTYDYVIPFSGVIENNVTHTENYYKLHFQATDLEWNDAIVIPTLKRKPISDNVKEKATAIREYLDLIPQDYIVILPSAGSPLRQVNFSTLQKIGQNISNGIGMDRKMRIIYLTSPDDKRTYNVIEGRASVIRESNLAVVSELISTAACVIGADTGLTHYASAIGVPTVSLWTCIDSTLILFSIEHSERATAITAKIDCAPCNNPRAAYCKAFSGNAALCTERIPVDEVCKAVNNHIRLLPEYASHGIVESSVSTSTVLSVEDALPKIDGSFVDVAIPITMTEMYTGGGFYCWYLARSIAAHRNMRVWVLVDSPTPGYFNGASEVPARFNAVDDPDLSLLFGEQKAKFSFVMGQPQREGLAAVRYAKENEGARAFCILYETPWYIRKYRGGQDAHDSFWADYKQAVEECDCCFVVSRLVRAEVFKWIPSFEERKHFLKVVLPIVDDAMCDTVLSEMKAGSHKRLTTAVKTNSVVLCSRNVDYKQMQRTVDLIIEKFATHHSTVENPFTVNIIGAKAATIARKYRATDLAAHAIKVVAYENCPEDKKWKLMGEAKALVHPSEFEGFGIPVAEGFLACTPVVAHPLPVFKTAFLDHPYYYTDDTSLLSTLHHIWNAWESKPGESSSLSKLQQYLFTAYEFSSRRFRAVSRELRLNTIFERHWGDTKKINAERLLTKVSGETLRIALVTPWNTCDTESHISKAISDNVQCTFRIFAPEVARGLVAADGMRVTRCYNKEFAYGRLVEELNKYAPDLVHLVLSGVYSPSAQINIVKFIQEVRAWDIPVVVSLSGMDVMNGFYKDVCDAASSVICHRRVATVSATSTYLIAPPCNVTSSVPIEQVRTDLGMDVYTCVIGLFGAHHTDAELSAFLNSCKRVRNDVSTKTEFIIHSVGNGQSRLLQDAKVNIPNLQVNTNYMPEAELVKMMSTCNILVACAMDTHPTTSVSSIIRTMISAHRPIVAVGTSKFDDIPSGIVTRVTDIENTGDALATKIVDIVGSKKVSDALVVAANNYAIANQTSRFATQIANVYKKQLR